uniref:uncharacterized protein LOC122600117 n=1 Tax=Erigeron canadensis TaxID=72917 RepID=UPI001CB9B1AF|nr:uncharacterized protein LOC122600117 [Erigeron canadensis]
MLPTIAAAANCYRFTSPPPLHQVCLYGGGKAAASSSFKVKCILNHSDVIISSSLSNSNNNNILPLATTVNDKYLSSFIIATAADNDELSTEINDFLSALVCNTDTAITNTYFRITSTLGLAIESFKLSTTTALSGISTSAKGFSSKAVVVAVDGFRYLLVTLGHLLASGYTSFKNILPPDLLNLLNSFEHDTFAPAFQQVYPVFEGTDPIISFLLLLGTSTTLWISYWILTYAGYAGDLSPNLTMELLNGKQSSVLIDVRPEDFRLRDGIPDLRRTARFRYASITFPEVDANVSKLLKSRKDLDDALVAAVIRNLKVVQEGSNVIVMDADGARSKGIARSLRKVGIKRPYQVQGGFRSWVQDGLRVKEPKPETTLTILNEEAEAILEDITPQQVIGYGVGFLAAAYALLEWETTLQLIAVIGLGQTIYQRVASYEDSKDFNRDVKQLLAPVKMGGVAISWAAGKLESNGNGLPTSPSSVNLQNRVLQAAAKHESQPSDNEEAQDSSTNSVNQSPDLSEA